MEIKIGSILKQLLRRHGLTLKALEQKTGVPASTLGEWSQNRSPKNPQQVRIVAHALDVSMHYLLFGEPDGKEEFRVESILKEDVFDGTFEINIRRVKLRGN